MISFQSNTPSFVISIVKVLDRTLNITRLNTPTSVLNNGDLSIFSLRGSIVDLLRNLTAFQLMFRHI